MNPDTAVEAAAEQLILARSILVPAAPVREMLGARNIDAAYAVQRRVIASEVDHGAKVVGAKIGLTAPAVQQQFGVFEPDFGVLLDTMVFGHTEPVPLDRFLQPRAEGEIAFVLGRDIDRPGATVADVIRAIDFVMPAIEIVDSRIAGWDLGITDTIADNASSGAVVLGCTPYSITGKDLSQIGMILECDGEVVSTGAGHACLGSPVMALLWLARELAMRGEPLRAGDVVMSGALGPMVSITSTGNLRLRLDGLGEVSTTIVDSTYDGINCET
jgi:2-keto-4-pentenoate hydratase